MRQIHLIILATLISCGPPKPAVPTGPTPESYIRQSLEGQLAEKYPGRLADLSIEITAAVTLPRPLNQVMLAAATFTATCTERIFTPHIKCAKNERITREASTFVSYPAENKWNYYKGNATSLAIGCGGMISAGSSESGIHYQIQTVVGCQPGTQVLVAAGSAEPGTLLAGSGKPLADGSMFRKTGTISATQYSKRIACPDFLNSCIVDGGFNYTVQEGDRFVGVYDGKIQ